jgi:hypothetical protein
LVAGAAWVGELPVSLVPLQEPQLSLLLILPFSSIELHDLRVPKKIAWKSVRRLDVSAAIFGVPNKIAWKSVRAPPRGLT